MNHLTALSQYPLSKLVRPKLNLPQTLKTEYIQKFIAFLPRKQNVLILQCECEKIKTLLYCWWRLKIALETSLEISIVKNAITV